MTPELGYIVFWDWELFRRRSATLLEESIGEKGCRVAKKDVEWSPEAPPNCIWTDLATDPEPHGGHNAVTKTPQGHISAMRAQNKFPPNWEPD